MADNNPKVVADLNWYVGETLKSDLDGHVTAMGLMDTAQETHRTNQAAFRDAGGFGSAVATKALTFENTAAGAHDLFTVTGDVFLRIVAVCKTNVASAGGCNIEVGVASSTAALIAQTDCTLLAAGEIWHDATPDSDIEALSIAGAAGFMVTTGADVILTVEALKQVDSGAVTFYALWTPLSADGAVVAA